MPEKILLIRMLHPWMKLLRHGAGKNVQSGGLFSAVFQVTIESISSLEMYF